MLLQHGLGDGPRLGRVVGRGLVGHHLDLRIVGEDLIIGVKLIKVGGRRRLAFEDRDLARGARALAAFLHQGVGLDQADLNPIGADIVVGRDRGLEIDLQDLDAFLHHALLEPRIGLQIRIVDDGEVRLLGDDRSDRASAGIGAPVGVADLEAVAEIGGLLLHDRRPALGEIEAHGERHEDHLLAFQPFVIGVALHLVVEALLVLRRGAGDGRCAERQGKRRRDDLERPHDILRLFILMIVVMSRVVQMSPCSCCAVCSSRGLMMLSTTMAQSRMMLLIRFCSM